MNALPRTPQMNLSELSQPAFGFVGATGSLIIAQISEAIPPAARGWVEGGAYVGFVAFLVYACYTLWKRLNDRDKEIAELNKEIRSDWKTQNDRLINVLDKLDKDG
jgi:hypothetical protein